MEWLLIKGRAGWPEHLIFAIEIGFVVAAILIALLGLIFPSRLAISAAIVSGLAIAYPFALAPLFFGVQGEWMLATLPLSPAVLGLSIFVSLKLIRWVYSAIQH